MIRRRAGVVTDRRSYPWHVFNHSIIGAKLARCSLVACGVYAQLRCMAGAGRFDGTIWCGEIQQMTTRDCSEWVARRLAGEEWHGARARAKEILLELRSAGLLIWGRDRIVVIVNFVAEQFQRPKTNAERVADHRARAAAAENGNDDAEQHVETSSDGPASGPRNDTQRGGHGAAHGYGDTPGARGSSAPPPAPLPSTPISTPTDSDSQTPIKTVGFQPTATLQCNEKQEQESKNRRIEESKNDANASSISNRRGRGAGGGDGSVHWSGDIYADDPIAVALHFTGERGTWARNAYAKKLREVGREVFVDGLAQYRDAVQSGVQPRGTRGGMLMGIINANARGGRG